MTYMYGQEVGERIERDRVDTEIADLWKHMHGLSKEARESIDGLDDAYRAVAARFTKDQHYAKLMDRTIREYLSQPPRHPQDHVNRTPLYPHTQSWFPNIFGF